MMAIKKIQLGKLRFRKVSGRWVWLWNGKHFKFGTDSTGR